LPEIPAFFTVYPGKKGRKSYDFKEKNRDNSGRLREKPEFFVETYKNAENRNLPLDKVDLHRQRGRKAGVCKTIIVFRKAPVGGWSMQGKVEISGVNTAKLRTLSSEEMTMLMGKAKRGDMEARRELIEGNLRLVLSVIQRFNGRGENPDDLFQVGCIGLLKAIANFDETKEVRFSTYGVPMIAGEIRRYLRDNSVLRVSRSLRDLAYRVLQCKEAIINETGREPSLEELSQKLEVPVEDISLALDAVTAPISLYDPVYADGGDPLMVMDQIKDTKNTDEKWLERIALRDAFSTLSQREKQILILRFYDGKTQMEVAGQVGISQAQVSRLEKNAINTMRKQVVV